MLCTSRETWKVKLVINSHFFQQDSILKVQDSSKDNEKPSFDSKRKHSSYIQTSANNVYGDVPTSEKTLETVASKYAPPNIYAHFKAIQKSSMFAEKRYVAPHSQAGMKLQANFGFNGNSRNSVMWYPETGSTLIKSKPS